MRYSNNFDLLRLIAALIVILRHSFGLLGNNDPLEVVTKGNMHLGQLGVAVFFTISGYLITMSLSRSTSALNYLKKRMLRIFPGLIVCILLTTMVLGPLASKLNAYEYFSNSSTWQYFWNISLYKMHYTLPGVFTSNTFGPAVNGSLWTLAYEFTFYILLLILSLIGMLKFRYVFLGVVLALLLGIYLGSDLEIYNYSSSYTLGLNMLKLHEFFLFFFIGCTYFFIKDRIKYLGIMSIILVLVYVAMVYFNNSYTQFLNYLLIPAATFGLAFIKGKTNQVGKIGDLSYGLYIYAFPIQQLIVMLYPTISVALFFALSALFVAPIAYASWHFIEKPAMSLKRKPV